MNLKIHFVGLAVIILLLVAIAYKTSQTDTVPQTASPYVIEIANATYGANCNTPGTSTGPDDPYAETASRKVTKNNVLSIVGRICNGKNVCSFPLNETTFPEDPASNCPKKLEVDYRCFAYDRPWSVSAQEGGTINVDCTKRGN